MLPTKFSKYLFIAQLIMQYAYRAYLWSDAFFNEHKGFLFRTPNLFNTPLIGDILFIRDKVN